VEALRQIEEWGATHAAAAVLREREVIARAGNNHVFRWASFT